MMAQIRAGKQIGFTLVEIAIVLVIVGILLSGVTGSLSTYRETATYTSTERYLEEARDALLAHVSINGYLPCPDTNADGQENRDGDRSCNADFGELPYLDLGLEATTPWDDAAFYAIHGRADANVCNADNKAECFFYNDADAFNLSTNGGDTGQLNVADAASGGSTLATRLQAIVGSYGSNPFTLGGNCANTGRSDDEDENCDADASYVLTTYRDAEANSPFDDQMVWIDELTLKSLRLEALAAAGIANSGGGGAGGGDTGGGDTGGGDTGDTGDTGNSDPGAANQPDGTDDVISNCEDISGCSTGGSRDGTDNRDILIGTNGEDSINGKKGNDDIYGLDGNDYLDGDEGNDLIVGGGGNDELYGKNNNDTLYGGAGNDTLYGDNHNDILYGGDDNDTLYGDNHNDVLYGGDGQDTLNGGNEDDDLYGGQGADILNGENGKDDFIYPASGGTTNIGVDDIDGGNGKDRIYIDGSLGTITIKQGGTTKTLTGTLSVSNSSGELFVDGVKWADFTSISEIVMGSP